MSDPQRTRRFAALFKPFAHSARGAGGGPITWRTWVGLIVVPSLIVGLLAWAFWSPQENHGSAQAAIVNHDKPVKVQGKPVPMGRELAGKIVGNKDSSFDWTVTSGSDARDGKRSGEYAAVVTIPKNFSKAATSAARVTQKGDADAAKHANVDVKTSKNSKVIDPMVSQEIAKATVSTLNGQLVKTYLNNLYVGFNSMHDVLGKAAKGAGKLADGSGKLAGQTGKLVDGTQQLSAASAKLNKGMQKLSSGTDPLAKGSGKLAGGLDQMAKQTAQLPAQTKKLAGGARQVAKGNRALANKIGPMADQIVKLIDSLPSADPAAKQFKQLAGSCGNSGGDDGFCKRLKNTAEDFGGKTGKAEQQKKQIRDAALQAKAAVNKLADGSEQVAKGNEALAAQTPKLTKGIKQSAGGAEKLNGGVKKLNGGVGKLADGTDQLADKTPQLASGTEQFQNGAQKLGHGAEKFAGGLDKGQDKVPTYSTQDRSHLKQVAANPALANSVGVPDFGLFAIALILAVALWALALATYILTRAMPPEVLTSREPTWKVVLRSVLPGAGIATATAVIISLVLIPFLHLGVADWFTLLGVTVLAANSFVALNHAVVSIFGRPGRFMSLAVLVLAIASGVVSTVPGFFGSIGGLLPTAGGIQAIRAVTTGADGLTTAVLQLAAWLVVAGLATIIVTDRRRSLPAKHLRLGHSF